MRICLFSREYPPETGGGGIGTYVHNLAHNLTALGHEVTVITQWLDRIREYDDGQVHVIRLTSPSPPLKKVWSPYFTKIVERLSRSWLAYKALKKLDKHPDIVEAPDFFAEGYATSLLSSYPLVTRLHIPLFILNRISNIPMKRNDRMANNLERSQANRSIGIHTYSEALKNDVMNGWGFHNKRIEVIPNGIDIERLRRLANEVSAPPIDGEYVVFLGRLEARKGAFLVADVLPYVLERYPEIKVIFVGGYQENGHPHQYLIENNKKFQNNIILTGYIEEMEKIAWIKYAKCVLTPSIWEAFGYTTIEPMALGKTVITTKTVKGVFSDNKEDGVSCYLIESGNRDQLKEKMFECLSKDQANIGKAAWEKSKLFDIKATSKRVANYYESLIG